MWRSWLHASDFSEDVKKKIAFDSLCEYGQLRFDENKNLPLLMLKLSYIPRVLLWQYFVTLLFNDEKYDKMIEQAKSDFGEKMIDSMFPDQIQKEYEIEVQNIENRRKQAFKENPDMSFFVEFYKYETKEYTNKAKEYWMTFSISTKTAMMIIEKKSKFDEYKVSFDCPDKNNDEQKETEIALSIIPKTSWLTANDVSKSVQGEILRDEAIQWVNELLQLL